MNKDYGHISLKFFAIYCYLTIIYSFAFTLTGQCCSLFLGEERTPCNASLNLFNAFFQDEVVKIKKAHAEELQLVRNELKEVTYSKHVWNQS